MLRDIDAIKTEVRKFFRGKDPGISIAFSGDQPLLLDVRIALGDREGSFRIQNKFFTKDGGWDELSERLAYYWTSQFPNQALVLIVPWP